ncbi:MAG: S1C family serine protease [Oscillospiraceae bacterium]
MSWYSSNSNWYKTSNSAPRSAYGAPRQQSKSPPPGSRRVRVIAVIACLCLIIAGVWIIASGGGSSASRNTDGMPVHWQDYMDSLYGSDTYVQTEIDIPVTDERGSFTLQMSSSGGAALDFSDIYDKCVPSVVGIKSFVGDSPDYYGWGSGVIISPDGYILTNTHVIDDGDSAKVVLYDGSEHEAKLVGYDSQSDIAVIKIEAEGLTAAEFASSSGLRVGDSVAAIGNPLSPDLRLTMTRGIISALNREISYNGTVMSLIQTDASINEGNSGGPLFNDRGQVIGITNMKMISTFGSGIEGLGFAIPSDTVQAIVGALIKDGAVYGRSTIGVTIGPISEKIADYYDIPQGLYVSHVLEGSDAEAQGIEKGDIIVKVNGADARQNSDVSAAKAELEIGDTIDFTVWRDGKTFDVSVKLMDGADISGD